MSTDGSQYKWVDDKYGCGLGFFDLSRNNVTKHYQWQKPNKVTADGMESQYEVGGLNIVVKRQLLAKYVKNFCEQLDKLNKINYLAYSILVSLVLIQHLF